MVPQGVRSGRASVTLTEHTRDGVRVHTFTARTTCLVGRGAECGIKVSSAQRRVSRHHILLDIAPPRLRLRDLGSRNGTYVNGERVLGDPAEHDLADGDEIRIGDVRLRVVLSSGSPTVPTHSDAVQAVTPHGTAVPAIRGYRILHELGRGGYGVVHLALHDTTSQLVALKTMVPQNNVDEGARQEFRREFRCLRALRHPHIVRFLASGSSGHSLFFTSEYCAGGSVADHVARHGGRLPVDRAVAIVLQVLDGLSYAHDMTVPVQLSDGQNVSARGLVHRDITPWNILLSPSGRRNVAKLADFGLAKALDTAGLSGHTRTGSIGGSVAFMPRSQLIDFKYARPEGDLWAVMACLYWMLTGTSPRAFPPGTDPIAVVLRDSPVPIREHRPSLPEPLADVIDTMLIDRPKVTVITAAVLAHALRQAVPGAASVPQRCDAGL